MKPTYEELQADLAARDALIEELRDGLRFYAERKHLHKIQGSRVDNGEHEFCPDGAIIERGKLASDILARTPAVAGAELARLQTCEAAWSSVHALLCELFVDVWHSTERDDQTGLTHALDMLRHIKAERDALRAQLTSAEADAKSWKDSHALLDATARELAEKVNHWCDRHTLATRRAEAAEARVKELELGLAAIGDLAVADWDDATVGKVDAVVKEPTKYADRLRTLFKANARLRAVTEALAAYQTALVDGPENLSFNRAEELHAQANAARSGDRPRSTPPIQLTGIVSFPKSTVKLSPADLPKEQPTYHGGAVHRAQQEKARVMQETLNAKPGDLPHHAGKLRAAIDEALAAREQAGKEGL